MKINFKKKVIAVTGLGVAGVTAATAASVLTAYKDQIDNKQSTDVDVPVNDDTGLDVDPGNQIVTPVETPKQDIVEPEVDWNEYRDGTIPSSVISRISEINLNFQQAHANDYGLEQNYNEFNQNGDFTKYTASAEKIKTDLYLFADSLWVENGKSFDILSFSINNFSFVANNKNEIILGSSRVSFDLDFEISAFKDTQITIFNKTFDLPKGTDTNLNISVNWQVVKPVINELTNEFYLGWEVDNANVKLGDLTFSGVLSPTKNSYSYAFQYIFDDLTDKQNYVELYKKYQPSVLNMDQETLKNRISNYYDQQFSDSLDYIDMGIKVLDILRKNPDIKTFLSGSMPYVAKIITKLNILPSFLDPLLSEGFANQNLPFVSVFQKNKQAVINYINQNMPDLASLASPIIEGIGPNMNYDQINELKSLLLYFGLDESIIEIFVNDFLGQNGKPKPLYDLLVDNISKILPLIITDANNEVVSGIMGIVNLFIKPDSKNNLTPIFSVIFDGKTNKQTFLSAIGKVLNLTAVSNILDIVFVNNQYMNLQSIQGILNSIYNFASEFFARKENYTDFKTGYKNLDFVSYFQRDPVINKQNQTISFRYLNYFIMKKEISLDLLPIKGMISGNQVWELINSFQDLSGYAWAINKEWLYQGVMSFIPNSISVGGTKLSITSVYNEAANAPLYFDPIKNGTDYNLGFKFDYKTTVNFSDQNLVSSLTNPFNSNFNWKQIGPVLVWGDYYYSDFWRSILSNVIARDYEFTSRAHIQYSSQVVGNVLTYDPNLYTTGFTITPTEKEKKITGKEVYDQISAMGEDKTHKVTASGYLYNMKWSNTDTYSEILQGITPIIPEEVNQNILNTNYSVTQNQNYLQGTNLTYKAHSDALFNFSLPPHIVIKYIVGKTDVNAKFDVFAMNFQLYLPFMYYDTVSHKMVDTYSDAFSQINNKVDSVGSWFWQSEFYN